MKNQAANIFGSLVLLGMLSSSAFAAPVEHKLTDEELRKFQSCSADKDCLAVTNGCCNCANGSTDVAINREMSKEYEARRKDACSDIMCTMMDRVPACLSGAVACVTGTCAYTEPKVVSGIVPGSAPL